ncbi:uncharacterized protein LOC130589671 [Beta vulgaris subsp. vulgaris]|uniref:uncharacterized protein LOC130589671 n=3 Tax=Beta vulgaris subsp. vulgaris TaxID=3555 RepID=UPI0025478C1E|nr:uncharacterized protein LOC130589671 [Beta vulgaris subsp. vulgaris]
MVVVFFTYSLLLPIFRATQSDLAGFGDSIGRVCWMCPQSTVMESHSSSEEVTKYILHAMVGCVDVNASIMFAPIFQDQHWMLLVICPLPGIVYIFDSASYHKQRKLKLKLPMIAAFRRFRMSGHKVRREKLLWKYVECPQQQGGTECGYFVMRYIFDVLASYFGSLDMDKVAQTFTKDPYTEDQINEVKNKWARYFVDECIA